jgi:hypothetical protein
VQACSSRGMLLERSAAAQPTAASAARAAFAPSPLGARPSGGAAHAAEEAPLASAGAAARPPVSAAPAAPAPAAATAASSAAPPLRSVLLTPVLGATHLPTPFLGPLTRKSSELPTMAPLSLTRKSSELPMAAPLSRKSSETAPSRKTSDAEGPAGDEFKGVMASWQQRARAASVSSRSVLVVGAPGGASPLISPSVAPS